MKYDTGLAVSMDSELKDALRELSQKNGHSMSWMIQQEINNWISEGGSDVRTVKVYGGGEQVLVYTNSKFKTLCKGSDIQYSAKARHLICLMLERYNVLPERYKKILNKPEKIELGIIPSLMRRFRQAAKENGRTVDDVLIWMVEAYVDKYSN